LKKTEEQCLEFWSSKCQKDFYFNEDQEVVYIDNLPYLNAIKHKVTFFHPEFLQQALTSYPINLDIIKLAFENEKATWRPKSLLAAVKSGRLDVVEYLVKNKAQWCCECIETAAKHGYLDILQYAIESNAPFSSDWKREATIESLKYVALTK
jgi:hypothetical protein